MSGVRGPVTASERALAPDLARGLMLLLIVVSNVVAYLYAARYGASGEHPVDGHAADRAARTVMIIALDQRVYPLFSFLFGYGMMRLYLRQRAAGAREADAARVLRRRNLALVVLGLLHATLLMAGDILGAYGVVGLATGWLLLRRDDRTVALWVGLTVFAQVWFAAATLWSGGNAAGPAEPLFHHNANDVADPLEAAGARLLAGLFGTFVGGPMALLAPQFALGLLAARRGVLEDPGAHLPLLRWTAAVGIAVGWLGAIPTALTHAGTFGLPPGSIGPNGTLTALRDLTGIVGGLGYVAAIALAAHALGRRERACRAASAVAALGKRSLSGYLSHSVLFAPVLAAWGLGLGARLNSFGAILFAVGVWLVTVVAAVVLERFEARGPAEAGLRRIAYGRKHADQGGRVRDARRVGGGGSADDP